MKQSVAAIFSSSRYQYFDIDEDDKNHFSTLYGDATTMAKIMDPLSEQEISDLFSVVTDRSHKNRARFFKIMCRKQFKTAGVMGFLPTQKERNGKLKAEFGILLYPQYYGNGTAKEAITALISFGFTQLNLTQAYATYNHSNTAIERIAQHLCFTINPIHQTANKRICTIDKTSFINRFNQLRLEKTNNET